VYFSCPAKRGIFVRPERVQVGDYEEVDEFASDDEEEI
jgi:tubulin-specific chaperone B